MNWEAVDWLTISAATIWLGFGLVLVGKLWKELQD